VLSAEFIEECIRFARREAQRSVDEDDAISSTSGFSFGFGGDAASSATSYTPDPHAVSQAAYYAGLLFKVVGGRVWREKK
jgi:hypothetical protein